VFQHGVNLWVYGCGEPTAGYHTPVREIPSMVDGLPPRIRDRLDLEALLARATNYEELRPKTGVRVPFKLDRVRDMLAAVGDPHLGPRTVHVAGSKGKGTVVRMLDAILRTAGRSPVGVYTSPHLEDLSERVVVDGRPASNDEMARAMDRLLPYVRRVLGTPRAATFFELITGMAWLVFRERGCTDVILETGLGGRLDATNACRPDVVLITSLELEHTEILGSTIEAIAAEKAGILKEGVPAATSAVEVAADVVEGHAAKLGVPLARAGRDLHVVEAVAGPGPVTHLRLALGDDELEVKLGVTGWHHGANALLAAWAARRLHVEDAHIVAGLEALRLPGVVEPLDGDPLVVVDSAHTPVSAAATREAVEASWPDRKRVLLVAMLAGKEPEAVARSLVPGAAAVVTTRLPTPRSMNEKDLARIFARYVEGPVNAEPDTEAALQNACDAAGPGGLVLATGSVRLAGLVRGLVRQRA
jgi:dihydrofolate synthase/folylpolyglutamate synthase